MMRYLYGDGLLPHICSITSKKCGAGYMFFERSIKQEASKAFSVMSQNVGFPVAPPAGEQPPKTTMQYT